MGYECPHWQTGSRPMTDQRGKLVDQISKQSNIKKNQDFFFIKIDLVPKGWVSVTRNSPLFGAYGMHEIIQ